MAKLSANIANSNFTSLSSYTDNPVICLAEDFTVLEINNAASTMFLELPCNIVGKNIQDICAKQHCQFPLAKNLFSKLASETLFDVHCDIITPARHHHLTWTVTSVFDEFKSPIGIMMIGKLNIGAFAKQAVNSKPTDKDKEIHQLKYILAKLPAHVYWLDKDGKYIGSNWANSNSAGIASPDFLIGKTDFELPWKENAEIYKKMNQEVMQTGKTITREEFGVFGDGTEAYFLSQKAPLRDEAGSIIGVLGNGINITDLKETQKKLSQAKAEAEIANELKSQFIANMEHDLRTPAAGILQMLTTFELTESNKKRKHQFGIAKSAARQLLDLLNDILDFSRTEQEEKKLKPSCFNLKKMLTDILLVKQISLTNPNLSISLDYTENTPELVINDNHCVQRILLNLIGNAIKFTKKGSVNITVQVKEQINAEEVMLLISIEDTGIGIPANKIGIIFQRFTKLHKANTGKFKGSGLGLNIVKQFITLLKGDIQVFSQLGKGTRFDCYIPFRIPQQQTASPNTTNLATDNFECENLQVLVVEDTEIIQLATISMLNHCLTKNIDLAATGNQAINLVKQNQYDLILVDIGLPDINGYRLSHEIRKLAHGVDTTIVAITAHSKSIDPEPLCKHDINDFMVKPLNPEKIRAIYQKWLKTPTLQT